jgi:hypothetical protein
MKKKKVFVLLPDGVGLRNFVYSNFYEIGKQNYDVVFWNNTPFDLTEFNYPEIKFEKPILNPFTDVIKNGIIQASLTKNSKIENDNVYDTYRFKPNDKGIKNKIRNSIICFINSYYSNQKGILTLRNRINKLERKTAYYKKCKALLEQEKPDFIFCTNQRPVVAIAPLLAAQDLKIPTATFIFSWDNLPKATMVVQTDYYFVWSDYMKRELLKYHPEISDNQIVVTGTPQFEPHFDASIFLNRNVFFENYGLDSSKKYICYSGDDITTCPDDQQYLNDTAKAVKELNEKGYNLGIIFRRCPVDFTSRYDATLEEYKDIIIPINPQWKKIGEGWNTVLPLPLDNAILVNTIRHSELVINLGSSMVFDFAIFNKPCLYINYDVENKKDKDWSVNKIYQFVHFRSMPSREVVSWISDSQSIANLIEENLSKKQNTEATKWLEKITCQPTPLASVRIWDFINSKL